MGRGAEGRGGEGSTCGVKTWLEAGETEEIRYCMIRSFATEKHATAATTRERAETGNKNYERKAKVQIFAFTLIPSLTFTIVLQIMMRLLRVCPVTSTTEQLSQEWMAFLDLLYELAINLPLYAMKTGRKEIRQKEGRRREARHFPRGNNKNKQ